MSKLTLSKKFVEVLETIGKSNNIVRDILSNVNTDMELVNNYIDVTDSNDNLQFTTERKASELNSNEVLYHAVTKAGNLLFKDSNKSIFDKLGFDMNSSNSIQLSTDTIGEIINKVVSKTSGRTYCLFRVKNSDLQGVINYESLSPFDPNLYRNVESSPWYKNCDVHVDMINKSRVRIRIGRLIKTIVKNKYEDSEIETFVNIYKSTYDALKNAFIKFGVLSGDLITKFYNKDFYVSGGGTLNSSCMAESAPSYFNIYSKNSNVKMVVLYADGGVIGEDGLYTSDKIKGRAILWKCKINGSDAYYMDRIYTRYDSDVNLFIEYAKSNGWFYKAHQNMEPSESLVNPSGDRIRANIEVDLDKSKTRWYPYMDTLCYIDVDNNKARNYTTSGDVRVARTTNGSWYS